MELETGRKTMSRQKILQNNLMQARVAVTVATKAKQHDQAKNARREVKRILEELGQRQGLGGLCDTVYNDIWLAKASFKPAA